MTGNGAARSAGGRAALGLDDTTAAEQTHDHGPHADDALDALTLDDIDDEGGEQVGAFLGGLDDPGARQRRAAIGAEDWQRFERNVGEILTAFGMSLDSAGTRDTPRRFLRGLFEATEGYAGDPKLFTIFPTECHGGASCELSQVVEGPIPFAALCEHHALPFLGRAYVGYVAHERIIGISKLTRLVRIATRRFGVQERMTHQIADGLAELTAPHGVAVYMEAHHLCTQIRGVREVHPMTRTTAFRGVYESSPALRAEFYDLARLGRTEP